MRGRRADYARHVSEAATPEMLFPSLRARTCTHARTNTNYITAHYIIFSCFCKVHCSPNSAALLTWKRVKTRSSHMRGRSGVLANFKAVPTKQSHLKHVTRVAAVPIPPPPPPPPRSVLHHLTRYMNSDYRRPIDAFFSTKAWPRE